MKVYILINLTNPDALGVYDSELLALKRKAYFEISFPEYDFKIVEKNMEYIDRE